MNANEVNPILRLEAARFILHEYETLKVKLENDEEKLKVFKSITERMAERLSATILSVTYSDYVAANDLIHSAIATKLRDEKSDEYITFLYNPENKLE